MDGSQTYKPNKESMFSKRIMKPVNLRSPVPSEANSNQKSSRTHSVCNQVYENIEANNNNYPDNLDTTSNSNFGSHKKDYMEGDPGIPYLDGKEGSNLESVFQGGWAMHKMYWNGKGEGSGSSNMDGVLHQDTDSMMSFNSAMTTSSVANNQCHSENKEQAAKADVVALLSRLKSHNKMEVAQQLLSMSHSEGNSICMMNSGCLPPIVQLLHDSSRPQTFSAHRQRKELRKVASAILHNLVSSQESGDKREREVNVLQLLDQVRNYADFLRNTQFEVTDNATCFDQQFGPVVASLMKLSFDEDHRHAMCHLGGLQAVAELMEIEQEIHGCMNDKHCVMVRRYSGMTLTNLTFGDGTNKALLCSMKPLMLALIAQLHSPSEELRQVSASVLRNLSWRADSESKQMLHEIGAVTTLTKAAMEATKESTLKSILSALWNLSAHCSENKVQICNVEGALGFLVSTLTYRSSSKNLSVVENGGGILRNVSSHIAIQNEHRATLRKHNCLQILLHHLKSPSLTVVSNACGTLWNLSARNAEDQRALWEMGAVGMLKKLINSKHKMISMGSSAALKNLLAAQPPGVTGGFGPMGSSSGMPSLHIRKQKLLNAEIDQTLSETYDNTDSPKTSPTHRSTHRRSSSQSSGSSSHRAMIPQRVMEKRSNSERSHSSQEDNESADVSHIPMNNVHRNPEHGHPRVISNLKHNSVKQRSVSHSPNRGAEGFSLPERTPIAKVNNLNSSRPHSAPAKRDKALFTPHSSNKANNAMRVNLAKNSCPSNKHNYANWAQKIKDLKLEEPECHEKPVNYSLKYPVESASSSHSNYSNKMAPESKIPQPKMNNYVDPGYVQSVSRLPIKTILSKAIMINKNVNNVNAEADLDQPIDFSRKYTERDSLEDCLPQHSMNSHQQQYAEASPAKNSPKATVNYEDTVKVYCTEGTPLNFSSSSSMTDLRDINGTSSQPSIGSFPDDSDMRYLDGPGDEIAENLSEDSDHGFQSSNDNKLLRKKGQTESSRSKNDEEDNKKVKFGAEMNFAQETPLMFSRSSSLGSLSSFDQPSIHDDRSSVSDFSRLASGMVSPSELPDSPGQTVPPSPQERKPTNFSFPISEVEKPIPNQGQPQFPVSAIRPGHFDEMKKIFTPVEGTPVQFSGASSLSSLSFECDHKPIQSLLLPNHQATQPLDVTSRENDGLCERNGQLPRNVDGGLSTTPNDSFCKESGGHMIEGTPVCFSRNSSLSSLSMESGDEMSSAEKAMLQECVQLGMPKKREAKDTCSNVDAERLRGKPNNIAKCGNYEPTNHGAPLSRSSSGASSVNMDSGDELSSAEKALLQECIQLGMPKRKETKDELKIQEPCAMSNNAVRLRGAAKGFNYECHVEAATVLSRNSSGASSESGDELSSAEKALLQECIQLGMPKRKEINEVPSLQKTHVAVECKGSGKHFSVSKEMQRGQSSPISYPKNSCPTNASVNKESGGEISSAEKALLHECIQLGMPKRKGPKEMSNTQKYANESSKMTAAVKSVPIAKEAVVEESPASLSGCSSRASSVGCESGDELSSAEKALLQECIQLGMPKRIEPKQENIAKQNAVEKSGIRAKTCYKSVAGNDRPMKDQANQQATQFEVKKGPNLIDRTQKKTGLGIDKISRSPSECEEGMSSTEQALLRECIQSGMPKRREAVDPSRETNSVALAPNMDDEELTNEEKKMLQQCVEQGMPKHRDSTPTQTFSGRPNLALGQLATKVTETQEQRAIKCENQPKVEAFDSTATRADAKDESENYSEICNEAQRLAEDMMEAFVDGTEDMTVSTLSCLSDIDNAHPPSAMADLSCLTVMNNSYLCEDQKMAKPSKLHLSYKNSLLKDLQISRLNSDLDLSDPCANNGNISGSLDNLSNSVTDIVENINPPSMLDDISFTGSTGSLNSVASNILDSKCDDKVTRTKAANDNSMEERMCDAAVMAQMYSKELTNITGVQFKTNDQPCEVATNAAQQSTIQAVVNCLEDVTDLACDTIGSDGDNVDDLPCDDESETLVPQLSSLMKDETDGSTENLTFTLTEELPNRKSESNEAHFELLRENADMILNSLRKIRISESSDLGCLASSDLLEDETISLVSNESDDDLSPDGVFSSRCRPDQAASDPEINMSSKNGKTYRQITKDVHSPIGLPICGQMAERKKFGFSSFSRNKQGAAFNSNTLTKQNRTCGSEEKHNGHVFDSSTFTRKKPSMGNNIPTVNSHLDSNIANPSSYSSRESVESSSTATSLSSVSSSGHSCISKPTSIKKTVASKIAAVWKNTNKSQSKATMDVQRHRSLPLENSASPSKKSHDDGPDRCSPTFQRPSSISRSSTAENIVANTEVKKSQKRPTSLMFLRKPDASKATTENQSHHQNNAKYYLSNSSPTTPTSRPETSINKTQSTGRKSMIPKIGNDPVVSKQKTGSSTVV